MIENTCAVILAAGKGTRMHSRLPKVLQPLLGEPMLGYVYAALEPILGQAVYTVVGHGADAVEQAFPGRSEHFIHQPEQLGTGHALAQALPRIVADGYERILLVNGDTPLLETQILEAFVKTAAQERAALAFLTITPEDIASYGRVVRNDQGGVRAIVEAKDYDEAVHGPESGEVNAGVYVLDVASIAPLVERLSADNAAGEYYVTDLVGLALAADLPVGALCAGDDAGLLGVNSPYELVMAEERLVVELVRIWMERGVVIHAPDTVRIGPRVRIAPGADITGPCELYGHAELQAHVRVASHCKIVDSRLEEGAEVRSFSHLEQAVVGPGAVVGPYARLRTGAELGEEARVGNFVEVKKARLGKGAKASHLSYLGDAEVGAGANIGAGTITCNYDGRRKHVTRIGEEAFIGSNTALVAPVSVGARSLVGAGSVITEDVGEDKLAIARSRQTERDRRNGDD